MLLTREKTRKAIPCHLSQHKPLGNLKSQHASRVGSSSSTAAPSCGARMPLFCFFCIGLNVAQFGVLDPSHPLPLKWLCHCLWTHPLHNITHPAQHTTLSQFYFATPIMDTLTQSYFATLTMDTLTVDSSTPCVQQCII